MDSPRGAPRGGEVEGLGGVEELDGGTDLQREEMCGRQKRIMISNCNRDVI